MIKKRIVVFLVTKLVGESKKGACYQVSHFSTFSPEKITEDGALSKTNTYFKTLLKKMGLGKNLELRQRLFIKVICVGQDTVGFVFKAQFCL